MYLSHEFISKCYGRLNKIGPETTGKDKTKRERLSALRYLLATSALIKQKESILPLDLSLSDTGRANKADFIRYVGDVVKIDGDWYTNNFAGEFKEKNDYGTGNNFFTTKVSESKHVAVDYPGRPQPLFTIHKEKVTGLVADIRTVLYEKYNLNAFKVPLSIWLLRNNNIDSPLSLKGLRDSIVSNLTEKYEENIAGALSCSEAELKDFLLELYPGMNMDNDLPLLTQEKPNLMPLIEQFGDKKEAQAVEKTVEAQDAMEIDWDSLDYDELEENTGLIGVREIFAKIIAAMKSGKNVILIGPPGTGKTEISEALCKLLGVEYGITTATSDWTTFDTIGGYFPNIAVKEGNASENLDFIFGLVLNAIENKRWLIIDEINRADIDKAYGQLFTLLSGKNVSLPYKKRRGGDALNLVLSHKKIDDPEIYNVVVPDGWRLIGTMNSFDKASLFQLSYAFMRRFAFIDVPVPSKTSYEAILQAKCETIKEDEPFYGATLDYLCKLFATEGETGLSGLGLQVGPAIPLDIIQYLITSRDIGRTESVQLLILQALEMYLYPQFEGKNNDHPELVTLIEEALNLDLKAMNQTGHKLSLWTGYEIPKL